MSVYKDYMIGPLLMSGEPVTFEIDLTKVQYNDDGSVVVGDPNSSLCFNGEFLLELLTKR
jgi:hypothetical protein